MRKKRIAREKVGGRKGLVAQKKELRSASEVVTKFQQ
jgi:hypothetical protein